MSNLRFPKMIDPSKHKFQVIIYIQTFGPKWHVQLLSVTLQHEVSVLWRALKLINIFLQHFFIFFERFWQFIVRLFNCWATGGFRPTNAWRPTSRWRCDSQKCLLLLMTAIQTQSQSVTNYYILILLQHFFLFQPFFFVVNGKSCCVLCVADQ